MPTAPATDRTEDVFESEPESGTPPWWQRLVWVWPTLAMLVVGSIGLTRPALWADELATWGAVRLDWSGLVRLGGDVDAVITPYYLLMKLWTSVAGTSTLALRLPSVLAVAAAAGLVTWIGARLGGTRAGLLGGAVFVVIPSLSRYGQDARVYAFATLAVCLATLALIRATERPTAGRWLGYGVLVAVAGLLHMMTLLMLSAHLLAVLLRSRRMSWRWAVAAAAGTLPVLPLVWVGYHERSAIGYLKPAGWDTLFTAPEIMFGSLLVCGLLVGLSLPAVSLRWPDVLPAALAVLPALVLFAVSHVKPLLSPRYLLYTVPAWSMLAGRTLGRVAWWRGAVAVLVLAVAGLSVQRDVRGPAGHLDGTKQIADVIAGHYRPGDGLAVALHEPIVPWEARDLVARYVPARKRPRDVFATRPQRTDGRMLATECTDLSRCLGDTPRLWVIRCFHHGDPLRGIGARKEALLRRDFRIEHTWVQPRVMVALLVRR
ncbi:glycosyltransferase family 39 protein [Actinocatenispora sera]|uniref:glycosyltransferase family 39 protein n=1 Tax=Actinocatenispora sera TaxID=390989 RepID=UPI0033CAAD27